MLDYLGREIKVGDIVVKAKFHARAEISLARVVKICEQKVKLIPLNKLLEETGRFGEYPTSFPDALLIINDLLEK